MPSGKVKWVDPEKGFGFPARKKPDDLEPIIEDLITLVDGVSEGQRHGRHPDEAMGRTVGSVLRSVATDLEG